MPKLFKLSSTVTQNFPREFLVQPFHNPMVTVFDLYQFGVAMDTTNKVSAMPAKHTVSPLTFETFSMFQVRFFVILSALSN